MIEIEIMDNGKRAYIPENLGECSTGDQYIGMSRFIWLMQSGIIDEPEFYTLSIYKLLGIQPRKKKSDEETVSRRFDNIAWLSQYVLNFFDRSEQEGEEGKFKIKLGFTHNPIPEFKHRLVKFTGPKDEMEDVTFGQYVEALGYFLDYEQFREYKTLISLLSVFYKNKNPLIPKSRKKLDHVEPGIAYGFYLFFASFHKYISNGTIVYNGIEIDLGIIFNPVSSDKTLPESDIPGLGMKSILFDIAGSGVFGTKKEVEQTGFWEVLLRLYDLRKKSIDEKEYYKSLEEKPKS